MKLKYHWTVNDDGLHIYEEGVRCIRICCWSHVAKIDPDQFKHLVAELAEHVRWQETRKG